MRKLIFLILCIPFLLAGGVNEVTSPAAINGVAVPDTVNGVSGVQEGDLCDTPFMSNTSDITGDLDISDVDTLAMVGVQVEYEENHTLCSPHFTITYKAGDLTAVDYYVTVHTIADGTNNAEMPAIAKSVKVTGLNTWNVTDVPFVFASPPTLSASVRYAVLIWMDSDQDGVLEDTDDYSVAAEGYAEFEYTVNNQIPGHVVGYAFDGTGYLHQNLDGRVIFYE